MEEILMVDKDGRWKRQKKKKNTLRKGAKEETEELPNCGILETGEINGSVPLLEEITKHLK